MITETENLTNQFENIFKNENSLELLSQFRNVETWQADTAKTGGMLKILGQHALPYFSPLRAAFLFEFKSIDSLSYYSPLLARDGALTLLFFFYQNPKPRNNEMKIIVSNRLKELVPNAWQKNVLTYSVSNRYPQTNGTKKKSIIFVSSFLGPKQNSKEYAAKFLELFFEKEKKSPEKIYWVTSASENQEDLITQDELIQFHNSSLVEVSFKSATKLETKSVKNLEGQNLSDFYICDLNEFNFYYSDSYITHLLMEQGASLLNANEAQSSYTIPLSFYHQLQIFPFSPEKGNESPLESFRTSEFLTAVENQHDPEKINFSHKICSHAFESFAFDVAQKKVK